MQPVAAIMLGAACAFTSSNSDANKQTPDYRQPPNAVIEGPDLICHFINIELVLKIVLLTIHCSVEVSCTDF